MKTYKSICEKLGVPNLREADLREADLRGADLMNADLRRADLSQSNLSDANLKGANLSDAYLRCASLFGADLRCTDLSGANLRDADLRCTDLSGANLSGIDLRCANLSGANLSGANLLDAKLPSPPEMLLCSWGCVSEDLCVSLMHYDATNHPTPELFDAWRNTSACPYYDVNVTRSASFEEYSFIWPGWELLKDKPAPIAFDLMKRLIKEKCKDSDYHEKEAT